MSKQLFDIYRDLDGALSHKWRHYFEIYERYFSKFVGRPVSILEIGVQDGGSLQMWRRYFGEQAKIIGVDISEHSKKLEEDGFQIEIGDQGDPTFMRHLRDSIGAVDIVVDDGSHRPQHQILALNTLFPIIREGGYFLCEDVYNSYLYRSGSFIDYAKGLIDELHGWWDSDLVGTNTYPTKLTKTCGGIFFHDGIVVLEKSLQEERFDLISGDFSKAPTKGKPPPEGPYLTRELLASLPKNSDGTVSFHQMPLSPANVKPLSAFPTIGNLANDLAPKTLYESTREGSAWKLCWGEPFTITPSGLLVDGFVRSGNYFLAAPGERYHCEFYVRPNLGSEEAATFNYYAGPVVLGQDGKILQRVARHTSTASGELIRGESTIVTEPGAAKVYIGLQGPIAQDSENALPCFEQVKLTKLSS